MRTLLIIVLLIIVGYFLLQYASPQTKKNTDTALKQAYNELKQKAKDEKVHERVEQGAKQLQGMASYKILPQLRLRWLRMIL